MLKRAKAIVAKIRRSTLARNSVWMFLGYGLKIIVQAGYFILIARALGPREYGAFVGVTALAAVVSPFTSLGWGNLLIKNVSRDRSLFNEYWGNALLVTAVSGVSLLAIVIFVSRWVLPNSIAATLILLVCISDLLCVRYTDIAGQAFQAVDQLEYTAKLNLLPYVIRFIGAAIIFPFWHRFSALCWGWFYLGSGLISMVVAIVTPTVRLGGPKIAIWRIRRELAAGCYFSFSFSAQNIYNDIDKTMLVRLSTLHAAGIYSAAYRLIEVAFAPVRSVLCAAYPNFFREGHNGLATSYSYAKRLLPRMVAYSAIASVGLFVAAPVIPLVLGAEYARTVVALRWLSLLPLLKTAHYFLADSLTGAGYQGLRTAMQIIVAVFNVALNFWLMPAYGWLGAAWASLASDAALVVLLFGVITYIRARVAAPRLGDLRAPRLADVDGCASSADR